ncbi:hypothetical protein [Kribbella catacumbae]|uniref:hypothetical protein n=1 Tax=Kribbella catacumbae TaxID=460086 RepID=UPI00037FE81B|nr:hypothetical protein [Kribbella catacumbae]
MRQRLGSFNTLLMQHLLISVVGSLLLIGGFGLAGTRPRPLWFVAMGLAIGFGSVAVRLIAPQALETSWPSRYDEKLTARRGRNSDNRTQFLSTWVHESDRERRAGEGSMTFTRRIRPLLLELTRDRLVHRHGVDPDLEPERAREVAGDQLWELITGTEARTATFAEIELAVQTIEKL